MRQNYNDRHIYDGMAEMRRDSKILLERINQDNFPYQDFSYAFYVNCEWKVLESLSRDHRIFGDSILKMAEIDDQRSLPVSNSRPADLSPSGPPSQSGQREIDLRQFFTRFSEGE